MKIYLMTDLEGVAGVLDSVNWCKVDGRYYDAAKELLTLEVNAAVEGFFEGGATEIVVADGHGPGGIEPRLIDSRVMLMRGWSQGFPLDLDDSYDAVAWVGQHAKAGTEYAHLAHTQNFGVLEFSINGLALGEFGQMALCANEMGVRSIFGSGDMAFTKEARALFPGIETVAVKYGTTPGNGEGCTADQYRVRNHSAIHFAPEKAREMIYEGALRAITRAMDEDFGLIEFPAPFKSVLKRRSDGMNPGSTSSASDSSSVARVINEVFGIKPIS